VVVIRWRMSRLLRQARYSAYLPSGRPPLTTYLDHLRTSSKMRSILIINPNSTVSMTDGLKPLVNALEFKDVNQHHSQLHPSN
jgi:hypothetical protein